ncbi:MAG TPA: response regulator [Candidatus Binatia bacterium]
MIVAAAPKILVVDDFENLRKLVATFLARLDYAVLQAADGRTAIKLAIAEIPKLILLDLLLPDMNGMEVARELRELSHLKHIPIIGWTANPIPRAQALLRTSLTDCLLKPVAPRVLRALVERFVPRPQQYISYSCNTGFLSSPISDNSCS